MRRAARSPRGKGRPAPTQCVQTQCFDPLIRDCVACRFLRPGPTPAERSSLAPGTALQPQESVGAGVSTPALASGPLLLFGAPALLVLAVALVLVALVSWRRRRPVPQEARDRQQDGPLDSVIILSSEPLEATAPVWPPPRENSVTTPPAHSVPVPATELGSTELVTTKTAGPEQQ